MNRVFIGQSKFFLRRSTGNKQRSQKKLAELFETLNVKLTYFFGDFVQVLRKFPGRLKVPFVLEP